MRVSMCVGDYAEKPYWIPGLEIAVQCMEELCFCIKENAFLLDTGIMNDELAGWIGEQCGLQELARELHPLIHKKGSLSAFISMIQEYVGLYDLATVREMEQVLKQGAGLSGIEKRKNQVDYLVKKKRYAAAVQGYDRLLEHWQEAEGSSEELPAVRVQAALYHNKGVALTGLFLYERAAECFRRAWELLPEEKLLEDYLGAKRIQLSEGDYVAFAAGLPQHYEVALKLEKTMEQLEEERRLRMEYQRLLSRREWRTGMDKQKYYDDNELLTQTLKDAYRDCVREQ